MNMADSPEQDKLERVLYRFVDSNYKSTSSDDIYMEKLLTHLSGSSSYLIDLPICKEWIQKMVEIWKNKTLEPSLASFVLRLMGLVVGDWKRFELLQVTDIVGQVSQLLKQQNKDNSSVKLAYVRMLSGLLKHDSGCKWIIRTDTWKDVLQFCYENQSIYVLRESQKFVVELLNRLGGVDSELPTNIMSEIFSPFLSKDTTNGKVSLESSQHQHFMLNLELACTIFEASLANASPVMSNVIQNLNLEPLMWLLLVSLVGDNNEEHAGKISKLLTLIYFTSTLREMEENKIPYSAVKAMEKKIYNMLALHVSRRSVPNFMKLVVQCQFCWHKISEFVSVTEESGIKHFNFDTQLMVFQLLPMLGCVHGKFTDSECLELYTNKLFRLTSEETQRLAYAYRDILFTQDNKHALVHQAMLSILQIKNIINRELAVIAFQGFMYNLKNFIWQEPNTDGLTGSDFILQHPEQLGAVLDGLISLIRCFHITWRESVETICLFSFTQLLLKDPSLSPKLAVQGLQLMQAAIQNFMPPNLALLMNTLKDSSIDQLGPILQKRLHDMNWDVRDSALEVLQVVTTIAEIKFPAFQEHVLENELCPLVLVLAMDDTESYVRASAIKCLCSMVRVQRFWTDCLASQDLPSKMMVILQSESEGIVRREAAALLKEIYEHHKFLKAELGNVFMAMAYAAVSDLHWEVKVNALNFWEKVIERQMSDQGMIDGVFPSVTFSKENRKIVVLTEKEIKLRLNKVLEELARFKCLQVLLSALQDHDLQVVYKAADIITTLNSVLVRHGIMSDSEAPKPLPDLISNCEKPSTNKNFKGVYDSYGCEVKSSLASSDKVKQVKTTNMDSGEGETTIIQSRLTNDSEKVIEAIVNETDINLLADVYRDYLTVGNDITSVATNFKLDSHADVSAKEFLSVTSKLDLREMVTQKNQWLDYCSNNLHSLLDDILSSRAGTESNAMDCY
ncbi:BRCA1-associated ATM activator 1 [Periplaneta americana]|uniref:BRCA1-associated ATM activator 1 n=1 Tax=Periplaneta americana TaxID=6978 RepID=UPI0037E7B804